MTKAPGRMAGPAGTDWVPRVSRPYKTTPEQAVRAVRFTMTHCPDDFDDMIDCLGLRETADEMGLERC